MTVIKDGLSKLTRARSFERLVSLLERLERERPGSLRVLTYHRVDRPAARPQLNPRLVSAPPEAFAEQMALLAAHYRVVALDEVLAACRGGPALPPRAVLVTFDDAYVDFADQAWPVMRQLGLPVTLFVPTGYPDRPDRSFWWDRLHRAVRVGQTSTGTLASPAGTLRLVSPGDRHNTYTRLSRMVKALPHDQAMAEVDRICQAVGVAEPVAEPVVLGWAELRRLAREGVSLAPHSRSHPLLPRVSPAQARAEITGSRDDLVREIGTAPPVFAYPCGGQDATTRRILADEGFEIAFTTEGGVNSLHRADYLRLRRINVGRRSTPATFRTRLLAWPKVPAWHGSPARG